MTHIDVLVSETIYYYSSLTLHFAVTICINLVSHHKPYWELYPVIDGFLFSPSGLYLSIFHFPQYSGLKDNISIRQKSTCHASLPKLSSQ